MASGEVAPKTKRVFINHVDLYHGLNYAKYLANCVVGAALDDLEEEEEEAVEEEEVGATPKDGCYQIIGTLKDKSNPKPDCVKEILQYDTRDQLYEQMIECDIIIYDINGCVDQLDEAVWAASEINADLEHIDKQKIFILVSSVMTWARSKPLDPDDPEIPFTEDDYRRRKAHPNFKEHLSCEKVVIKVGKTNKSKLSTYVVASGLTYGCGENIFHSFFKEAWHNAPELKCYGTGGNVVPAIHVRDLAGVLQNICDAKPKTRYIIASDDSQTTLEDIIRGVSTALGTGKVTTVPKEEALLQKQLDQIEFDQLMANIRMDAVFIKENMKIHWVAETGIAENMERVVKEYKETRNLLPMRVCILGPPASGKTVIAEQLCKQYKLHHIKIKDVINDAIAALKVSAARAEGGEEEDEDGRAQEDAETLEAVQENMENNNGRLEDSYLVRFFKEKLKSMPCQNQGYILDGFPKTTEQAKDLFGPDEEDEGAEEEGAPKYDKTIMPQHIIVLKATDEFLKARVMNLSETLIAGTHNNEDGLNRRLADYKALNLDDETVLNFFDELEFFPESFDVTQDTSEMSRNTVEAIKSLLKEPRNYGPTQEEREEMERIAEAERIKKAAEAKAERERQELEEANERKRRQEEWARNLEEVKREEYELLEARSVPLRNYLMKHVMPTLTQGLIECCKVRPEDSIDFLAEYLFQHNPQVD